MKNLIFTLALFCGYFISAQSTEWHVKPATNNANTLGDGLSFATAWSLQNALNNPGGVIKPGDTVWLHGGDYKGNFVSSAALSGTVTNYITVSSYPGEWARLDGNVFPYVAPTGNVAGKVASTIDQEMASYKTIDETPPQTFTGIILTVESGFVQFENFEVTCLGNINRLKVADVNDVNCEPTNGYNGMTGINHIAATVNRYVNLVVRNVPGVAMGSWKDTANTEVYGCLFYNNGYILHQKATCGATAVSVIGKGPGIYSQNTSLTQNRRFINNIFMNNYDSGLFVWSATSQPTFDYLRNYDISRNIFVNNGGPQRDETANMIVKSNSINAFNHPSNINIDNNVFYINDGSSFVSGLDVRNSSGVNMSHNFIFKGTAGVTFTDNNTNINFHDNYYHGKRLQTLITPTNYNSNNWYMDFNKYYTRSDASNMFEIVVGSTRHPLATFQSLYGDELNSTRLPLSNWIAGFPYYTNTFEDPKSFITQNQYNPNVFYVTVHNTKPFDPNFDNIAVDFSSYGIPAGTNYRIRDAQNYFGTPITGSIASNSISFPMTLTDFEQPIGYVETTPVHSVKDLSVFVVEFGCNTIPFDLTVQNQTDNSTLNYRARNNITFGANYITQTNAVIDARASKKIILKANTKITAGSYFLAKIEDVCPDILYAGLPGNFSRMADSKPLKTEGSDAKNNVVIYPNPNNGNFELAINEIPQLQNSKVNINVFDINGRVVYQNDIITNTGGTSTIPITLTSVSNGVYFVKVSADGYTTTLKFVKN
ncbi:MAG: T9SS type A sorting domain-containing protein [Flavobacterium sp. JAD_PAG50586_2]|nr:MAG: T9SS type A sorting domain-containing protein [Flavobacterium sp. JAD_PAG50586_2]